MHYWTLGRTPRKPQYLMAPEIPLVLLPVSLKLSSLHVLQVLLSLCIDAGQALHGHSENECRLYQLRAAIFHEPLYKDSSSNGVIR
ncbi:hypothetical protein NC652_014487 [Populus alba x Populus x berolinensis]|nr:hypothetical protein NC652_014487 [Populus alba x Populus x berolinensis]